MRDEAARERFAAVYDDHIWDVYGFIAYRVRTREEAEDLTQLAFERALRAWAGFDPQRASVKTWLLAIARNALIDHYRRDRSGRQEPIEGEVGEAALGSIEPEEKGLGPSPELEGALATLGGRDREIIALRFGGDMTGAEIAELTGLTLANVQQILSRSLRALRGELEGADPSGGEGPDPGDADRGDRE